jgi:phosphoribosylamine--glycine ligase
MLPFNHTIERKQLMNDNLGPSGGCAGNVVWNLTKGSDRVVDEGVALMASALRYNNYIGPFDFNTIVNEEGVWWLENTPRFGYDAMPAFLQTLDQPIGEFFSVLAREEHPTHILVKEGFGAALRLTVPPYPTEKTPSEGGLPVRGWRANDRANLYLYNVALDEKAQLVTTSAYGNVVSITSFASTIYDAMEHCLSLAKKALVPNKQYRTDLASLFVDEFYKLESVLGDKATPELAEASISVSSDHP